MTLRILYPYTDLRIDPLPGGVLFDCTGDDHLYGEFVRSWWRSPYDLLIIEHDVIVPPETVAHLAQLEVPAHVPYECHPARTGRSGPLWSARKLDAHGEFVAVAPGSFAEFVGLGCTFLPAGLKARRMPLLSPPVWREVEEWVGREVRRWSPQVAGCAWWVPEVSPVVHLTPTS